MSSSSYHSPPNLRRVGLHSHGKRPFEECGGYDSDMPIQQPTSSGTSSSSSTHRFSTSTSSEARNKRARSTSSTSTDDSNPSSSGYNTAQSSSRSDLSDGPSALSVNAVDCPMRPVTSPRPTQQVHMSNLHLPQPHRSHVPTPPMPEDTLRTSLQRFAEFDRQIAALRTSLVATRPPPLPPFGPSPSADGSSNHHWHPPNPSNFLSDGTSALASSNPPIPSSNTLDSFPSSNDSANLATSTSTTSGSSVSFTPTFSNLPRYPLCPYRPSTGGSSLVPHERMGETSASPAIMRPSPNENARATARSSLFVEGPPSSHIRHLRGRLSPLAFPSDPPSLSPPPIVTDDVLLRYRAPDLGNPRSQRGGLDNPLVNQERQVSSSRLPDQSASHARPSERARVIREHSTGREPVPTVFDVFSLADSSQNQSRPASTREPGASRHMSIAESVVPRAFGTHNERPRGLPPMTNNNQTPQDPFSRLNSSWASIPSSNSLMSESASERRHALALERFRARSRRSSFDADDESEGRWLQDSPGEPESGRDRVPSPIPPSPSIEGLSRTGTSAHVASFGLNTTRAQPTTEPAPSTSLHRSFSELFSETERIARDEQADAWLLDWDASRVTEQERQLREQEREREQERGRERERQLDRQRQRTWEWELERHRERSSVDAQARGFTSGMTRSREESHPPVPPVAGLARSSGGPGPSTTLSVASTTTTSNGQHYSYSNLNLSSFQSGLFRDSLRRNAEVDQASFSSSVAPSVNPGESRATSRLGFEDSESDMDLDDFVRTRPPSPEWSRPQPYAGRTPPPDYSPPPRNFSLRPGFSVWRRGSVVFDSPTRTQHQRNTFTSPVRPGTSAPARPTYENNQRPASERAERERFLPTRIFESFYRSHEDGRRSASTAQSFHVPQQNHTLASGSHNDVTGGPRSASANGNGNRAAMDVGGDHRRGSLGLGGSIRSRLARFTNAQSPTEATTRPRLASHPIGARPQTDRRRAVFGIPVEQERSGAMGWSAEPVLRDVQWGAPSGARGTFGPASAGTVRNDTEVEQRSRLRTLRQRFQLDRGEGMRVFRPGMLRAAMGRRGNMGDYVPDELFDDSYEALLSLSSMLGEVRSRATPDDVIASLPTGTFKEWKKDDSETRCPICLEDYEPLDVVTKLIECPHWLHKNCLEQWLRTANTCPVCREKVKSSPKPAARRRPIREPSNPPDGTSNSAFGRPSQANTQTNNGRPVSFAIVFDRMMNDPTQTWPPLTPGTRDAQNVFRERLRAREQPVQQRMPHGQDVPFHVRVPPPQAGSSSRPSTSAGMVTEGRPLGFVPLLRGQGSDSSLVSTSSSTSSNMVVDEVRRPVIVERTQPSFDAPTVVVSNSSEWRVESRSSSSGSSSRPITSRLPIHEDSPSEEYVFGWHRER